MNAPCGGGPTHQNPKKSQKMRFFQRHHTLTPIPPCKNKDPTKVVSSLKRFGHPTQTLCGNRNFSKKFGTSEPPYPPTHTPPWSLKIAKKWIFLFLLLRFLRVLGCKHTTFQVFLKQETCLNTFSKV